MIQHGSLVILILTLWMDINTHLMDMTNMSFWESTQLINNSSYKQELT